MGWGLGGDEVGDEVGVVVLRRLRFWRGRRWGGRAVGWVGLVSRKS